MFFLNTIHVYMWYAHSKYVYILFHSNFCLQFHPSTPSTLFWLIKHLQEFTSQHLQAFTSQHTFDKHHTHNFVEFSKSIH